MRAVRPLLLRPTATARHASTPTRLSPDAMDAAIQEMNQEMEQLFGAAPVSDPRMPMTEPPTPNLQRHVPSTPPSTPIPRTTSISEDRGSSRKIERSCLTASAALCGKMDALATQLAADNDAEQSSKLANSVAACASALREVVALQRATRPETGPPEV